MSIIRIIFGLLATLSFILLYSASSCLANELQIQAKYAAENIADDLNKENLKGNLKENLEKDPGENNENNIEKNLKKDLKDNFNAIYRQCRAKNYAACYYLGLDYYYGRVAIKDDAKSKDFLNIACDGGEDKACFALIKLHMSRNAFTIQKACSGEREDICILESIKTQRDEEQKDAFKARKCKLNYEYCYEDLDEISEDRLKLYAKECKKDRSNMICGVIGDIYSRGIVAPKDSKKAKNYYQMACVDNNIFCKKAILETILNK